MANARTTGASQAGAKELVRPATFRRMEPDLRRIVRYLHRRATEENVFGVVQRVLRNEALHSDILRWLLDPKGWHGLGDRFSKELLRQWWERNRHTKHRATVPRRASVRVTRVESESPTGRGPIDILIEGTWGGRAFVFGIENKVDAPEGREDSDPDAAGQLVRYANALTRRVPRSTTVLVALLTPDGRAPWQEPKVPWAALGYLQVSEALEAALQSATRNAASTSRTVSRGSEVARNYLSVVRRHIMKDDPQLTKLCDEFYHKYKDAWRAIRTQLPSEIDERNRLLCLACRDLFEETFGGKWAWAVRRDYYVILFRPAWLKSFGRWSSSQLVDFEQDGASKRVPAVHYRVVLDIPREDQMKKRPTLVLRLKCDLRKTSVQRRKAMETGLAKAFPGDVTRIKKGVFTLDIGRKRFKTLAPDGAVDETGAATIAREVVERNFGRVPLRKVGDIVGHAARRP